eukprot:m.377561 g.377561  ORF g.377561 m.377561 type:complete len:1419 (-) comp20022_c0_seq1:448-4704(-)
MMATALSPESVSGMLQQHVDLCLLQPSRAVSDHVEAYLHIHMALRNDDSGNIVRLLASDGYASRLCSVIMSHLETTKMTVDLESRTQAALKVLGFLLHHEQTVATLARSQHAEAIGHLVACINTRSSAATPCKATCTLAAWCLSEQNLDPEAMQAKVPDVVAALVNALGSTFLSPSVEHEVLNVVARLLKQVPEEMLRYQEYWVLFVLVRVVSAASKVAHKAVDILEDTIPSLQPMKSDSFIHSALILAKNMVVPALAQKMPQKKSVPEQLVGKALQAIRTWAVVVAVLGSALHHSRPTNAIQTMNDLLCAIKGCFPCHNPSIRAAAYVAWGYLIDNFASDPAVLTSAKRFGLLTKPLLPATRPFVLEGSDTASQKAVLTTLWRLIARMSTLAVERFEQLVVPFLESCFSMETPLAAQHDVRSLGFEAMQRLLYEDGSAELAREELLPLRFHIKSLGSDAEILHTLSLLSHFLLRGTKATAAIDEPNVKSLIVIFRGICQHVAACATKGTPDSAHGIVFDTLTRVVASPALAQKPKSRLSMVMLLHAMLPARCWTHQAYFVCQGCNTCSIVRTDAAPRHCDTKVSATEYFVAQAIRRDVLEACSALQVAEFVANVLRGALSKSVPPLSHAQGVLTLLSNTCKHIGGAGGAATTEATTGEQTMSTAMKTVLGAVQNTVTEFVKGVASAQGRAVATDDFDVVVTSLLLVADRVLFSPSQTTRSSRLQSGWTNLLTVAVKASQLVCNQRNALLHNVASRLAPIVDKVGPLSDTVLSAQLCCATALTQAARVSPARVGDADNLRGLAVVWNCLFRAGVKTRCTANTTAWNAWLKAAQTLVSRVTSPEVALVMFQEWVTPFANMLAIAHTGAARPDPSQHLLGPKVLSNVHALAKSCCLLLGRVSSGADALVFDSPVLAILSPMFESGITHPHGTVATAMQAVWNTTFGCAVLLDYSDKLMTAIEAATQAGVQLSAPGAHVSDLKTSPGTTLLVEDTQLTQDSAEAAFAVGEPRAQATRRRFLDGAAAKALSHRKAASPLKPKLRQKRGRTQDETVPAASAAVFHVVQSPKRSRLLFTEHQKELRREHREQGVGIATYTDLDEQKDASLFAESQNTSREKSSVGTTVVDESPPKATVPQTPVVSTFESPELQMVPLEAHGADSGARSAGILKRKSPLSATARSEERATKRKSVTFDLANNESFLLPALPLEKGALNDHGEDTSSVKRCLAPALARDDAKINFLSPTGRSRTHKRKGKLRVSPLKTGPFFPDLVDCGAPVNSVLSHVKLSRGCRQLLLVQKIQTVGDLCRRSEKDIQALRLTSPMALRRALRQFADKFQAESNVRTTATDDATANCASGSANGEPSIVEALQALVHNRQQLSSLSPAERTRVQQQLNELMQTTTTSEVAPAAFAATVADGGAKS